MKRGAFAFLLVLGLAQMAGDLAGLRAVKGVAGATGASPAPKVFSAVKGLETFSSRFVVEYTDADGVRREQLLTPQNCARLRGPYNRRNVYGAVLSYGPVLLSDDAGRRLWEGVARYALSGKAPLLEELGVRGARDIVIRVEPLHDPGDLPLRLEPPR